MDRRGFARVAWLGALSTVIGRPAWASLARAVQVQELVQRSQHVMVSEPLDAQSVWEYVGRHKHIVTYTRVRVLEPLAGADPKQDELLVRTLGGRVGDLGELVHGEAMLGLGARSVLFVMPTRGALAVTAMAQGHYPLVRDTAGAERLRRSPETRELLNEQGSAVARLSGLQVLEARALLKSAVQK